MVNKDDENMSVTISTTIQGTPVSYQTETTEEALILLAKNLPEKWHIKSCVSLFKIHSATGSVVEQSLSDCKVTQK